MFVFYTNQKKTIIDVFICGYAGGFGTEPVDFAACNPQLEDTFAEESALHRNDVWVSLEPYNHISYENMISSTGRMKDAFGETHVKRTALDYHNCLRMNLQYGFQQVRFARFESCDLLKGSCRFQRTESDRSFGVVGLCDPSKHWGSSATLLFRYVLVSLYFYYAYLRSMVDGTITSGATMYYSKNEQRLSPVDPAQGYIPSAAFGPGLKSLLQGQLTEYIAHEYSSIVV